MNPHAKTWKDNPQPSALQRAKAQLGSNLCTAPKSTFKYDRFTDLRATFERIREQQKKVQPIRRKA